MAKRLTLAIVHATARDAYDRVRDAVNHNADVIERAQKRLECVSADRMATQIDLDALAANVAVEANLCRHDAVALAARIDRIGKQHDELLADLAYRRAAADADFVTFGQRLRWLLTGK